jgi:methyl coenzyme M reductase alpha subunit
MLTIQAAKGFTSSEASQVIGAAQGLSQEINQVSSIVVEIKNNIPASFHGTIADDLRVITAHAKAAGEAVVNDCPVGDHATKCR